MYKLLTALVVITNTFYVTLARDQCNKPHEYYDAHAPTCPPQTCESIGKRYHCPIQKIGGKGACRCEKGYYRNKIGECISKANCEKCCCPHEYFSCGSACDNVCATLNTQNQTNCPIQTFAPTCMCYCEEGYARDGNDNCVPINRCPPLRCKRNEIYENCPDNLCMPLTCSELGYPIDCPLWSGDTNPKCPGQPGCICDNDEVRDYKGRCIPKNQCPSCGGDPNAEAGCGINCGRKCSNYMNKNVACPAICMFNGCDCKQGYVFDDNLRKCVLPEDCTQVCRTNEVYSNCANGGCRKRKCSDPKICVHPKKCEGGCICRKGYTRNENNECIPEEQCPASCGGDPNAVPGCGINCGRLCSNYMNKNGTVCPLYCIVNGCDCRKNYVYDENLKKCVLPEDCTQICEENEVYDNCANGGCRKRTCAEQPICIDPIECYGGCVCRNGFTRDGNNRCIPEEYCPDSCGGDPNALPGCGINCGRRCSNYMRNDVVCTANCLQDGCDCKEGYVYDDMLKQCVLPEDCTPVCKHNEVYNECANGGCRKRKCSGPIVCARPIQCKGGCICEEGYTRDENNRCIPEEQCPEQCNKPHEFYDPNPPICPPQTCESIGKDYFCPRQPAKPKGACRCVKGYYRNKNGDCISEKKCLQCRKPHEYYKPCAPTCPPQTCESIGKSYACPANSGQCPAGACRCENGYYRNKKGECISENDCKYDDDGSSSMTINKTEAKLRLDQGIIALSGEFIYQWSQSNPDENFVASANSIIIPLAQLAIFAVNKVSQELLTLFNLNNDKQIKAIFPDIVSDYKQQLEVIFEVASKSYTSVNYPLTERFIDDSKIYFNSSAENIDFNKNEQAAKIINDWVSETTRGKIKDLVSADSLDANTVTVLVNAVYFLGNWIHQFNSNYTEKRDFTKRNGDVVKLDMMYQKNSFNYMEDKDRQLQAVELPYKGGNFSFLVILPGKDNYVKTIQSMRNPDVFVDIYKRLTRQDVRIWLPKMEVNSDINMKEMLQKNNITEMFKSNADGFKGILKSDQTLSVSAAKQKAYIKVDEKGTEAAAATAVVVTALSAVVSAQDVFIFNANHSFIFYIILDHVPMFCGTFVGAE